jgi:hypothetical protein
MASLVGTSTIKILGFDGPYKCLNGRYDPVAGELHRGVSVYRFRGCPDVWLEFGGGGRNAWAIKPTSAKGSANAWAFSADLISLCLPDDIPSRRQMLIPNPICTWSVAHGSGDRFVDMNLQLWQCSQSDFLTDMFEKETLSEQDRNFIFAQMDNIISKSGKDRIGKEVIRIYGAFNGPLEVLNGKYEPTEEVHGGVTVYRKRDNPDIWLEFGGGGKNSWQIKPTSDKGTNKNWAYVDVTTLCLPEHIPTRSQYLAGQVSDWKVAVGDGTFEDKWLMCEPEDPAADIITEFVLEKLQDGAKDYVLTHIALAVLTGGAASVAYEMYSHGKAAMAVFNLAKLIAERSTAEGKVEITKALLDELWGMVMP